MTNHSHLQRAAAPSTVAAMDSKTQSRLRAAIRDVPDFPQPGVMFKDITPVLADPELMHEAIEAMAELAGPQQVDKVVGIDARGFIFGALLAARLGCGFIPARKKGKLPWRTRGRGLLAGIRHRLDGDARRRALRPGENVLLADDLLATGGTAGAALKLMQEMRGRTCSVPCSSSSWVSSMDASEWSHSGRCAPS